MNGLRRAWDSAWFEPAHAGHLALLRILVGGFFLWWLWVRHASFTRIASTNPALFDPVGPAWLLHSPDGLAALLGAIGLDAVAEAVGGPLGPGVYRFCFFATILFNVLFVLGLRFRITGPVFALLLLWLLSYRNSWTMIYHSANLGLVHVIILGLAPSAAVLSLDAWLDRRLPAGRIPGAWPRTDSLVDWRYGWPIRLMMAATTLTYFLAGVAKVAGPMGLSWAKGTSLLTYIQRDGIRKELLGSPATDAAYHVHEFLGVLTFFSVMTLIIELGGPLVMLGRRGSRYRFWAPIVWAFSTWCMHWGILLIMGIEFRYQRSAIAFGAFLPLGLLFTRGIIPLPGSREAR